MILLTIQVTNPEGDPTINRLNQMYWASFVEELRTTIRLFASQVYFAGFSPGNSPIQSACWVVLVDEPQKLKSKLVDIRFKFGRESEINVDSSETLFL